MAWVTFNDRAAFDAYHLAACSASGIPRPGKLQSDGTVMIEHQWTQAHVDILGAFTSTSGAKLLVNASDADVLTYGLTLAPNDPTFPVPPATGPTRILFEGAQRTVFTVARDWMQPKPVSWTDPDTNVVYPVT